MGPTASGKTALAIELAKHLAIEIINVDSALVYKGMDIGTGKPSFAERTKVVHHLVDIIEPIESYSVANFTKDAFRLIEDIIQRNKVPVLVGGTHMYFWALEHGLSQLPAADTAIRQRLEQQIKQQGIKSLHTALQQIDPQTAARLNVNDTQRILRALEVHQLTGTPLSSLQDNKSYLNLNKYQLLRFAVLPATRQIIHENIAKRLEAMLAAGFVNEVEDLLKKYALQADMSAMRTVGYRQILAYLNSMYDYPTMVQKILAATRQLAKRQCTWLNKWQEVNFIQPNLNNLLDRLPKSMLDSL